MVSQEIRTNAIALGALMHQVDPEQAAVLRLVKTNLIAAADHAEELERSLVVPKPEVKAQFVIKVDAALMKRTMCKIHREVMGTVLTDCTEDCEGCEYPKEVAHGQN